MTGDISKCPTCSVTSIRFDPPIAVEAGEACGAVPPVNRGLGMARSISVREPTKPGTTTHTVETEDWGGCVLRAGHDGEHLSWTETTHRWSP